MDLDVAWVIDRDETHVIEVENLAKFFGNLKDVLAAAWWKRLGRTDKDDFIGVRR